MAKYFRQTFRGEPEEITLDEFIKGVRSEFMFGPNYYEHIFMLFGSGAKEIGSSHMYWMEWK